MASISLHPFSTHQNRNRAIAPVSMVREPTLWERLSRLYWDGLELHVRDLDLAAEGLPFVAADAEPVDQAHAAPVVRLWRGRVRAADADGFHRYIQRIGAPSYRRARGNLGVWVLRRPLGETVEFALITHWATRDDIAAYTGNDPDQPLHFAETEQYLLRDGEGVEHFELLPEAAPRLASARL